MQDDKRMPSRLSVPSRQARDIESYSGGGGAGGQGEPAGTNILGAIWRRKAVVLACIVVGVAIGTVVLMRSTKMYASMSQVYVQQGSSQPSQSTGFDLTPVNSAQYLFTQCQLITSTTILSRALEVPGVADTKILRGENPVGVLKYHLTAQPTKTGDFITVTMESPYPEDAAVIVNGVVKAYIDYQAERNQSNAEKVITMLRHEYDSRKADLDKSQKRMMELVQENPDLNFRSSKGGLTAERLSTLGNALTEAKFRDEDLRGALNLANTMDPGDYGSLRSVVDEMKLSEQLGPTSLPMLSSIAQQYKMRLDELHDAGKGLASDEMRKAQGGYDRAQADMAQATRQAAASCVALLKSASAAADAHLKQIQDEISKERMLTKDLSAKEVEYSQMEQSVTHNSRSMDLLDERIRSLEGVVNVTAAPMTITVLETGKPNPVPVSPVLSKILGLSGVAGMLVGMGLALLLDKLDQRIRSIEEIASLLDATILGVVPRIVRRVLPGEAGREIQLRPRSGVSEAFRTVRTAIYYGHDERSVRTILITSPTPGDGKSTCISNLAIAVAQAGRRVLLIDADCRRPVQHKTFKVPETEGLTGILAGRCTLAEAVQHTEVDRLDLLQCGPLPHNPAELLDSQALLDLLGETAKKYDQVLIDSPPVTLVSDARVLAGSCDASLLVLRAERSTRRGATLAWNALASVGANMLGVVVNDFSRQKDGYGYTYYGYGRYGYAPAAPEINGGSNGSRQGNGKSSIPVVSTPD